MPKFDKNKERPKIEEVTRDFGVAHAEKADAEKRMAKTRKLFFDLIEIPDDELAQQTIYYDGEDPEQHVAALYSKWKIIKQKWEPDPDADGESDGEWHILIQEDPEKKSYQFINPLDEKVYARTVAESAPQIDMERLGKENPHLWQQVTFQPPLPKRELKPLKDLDDEEKAALIKFLTPVKLTNTMVAPRKAKPEELENLES